jgi:hypothetical protein
MMTRRSTLKRLSEIVSQRFFRLLRRENGSALLELAVAFPILLLLAVGVADFARIYYTGVTVANAAEAGAFYGVVYQGDLDSMTVAAQRDAGNVTLDSIAVGQYCRCPTTGVVGCASGPCPDGYGVPQIFDSVSVKKTVTMMIRYVGLPSTVTLWRSSVMREK